MALRTALTWGALLLVSVAYASYALAAAGVELLHLAGLALDVRPRSAPLSFVVHALAGTAALVGGALQLVPVWRLRWHSLHRMVGRLYALGVAVSGATALRLAVTFDVPVPARLSFALLAMLWLGTTTSGVLYVRAGVVVAHRRWMLRSYALTLFFVTGSLWMEAVPLVPIPYAIAYPVAVTLGWVLNLAVAEAWIRASSPAPARVEPSLSPRRGAPRVSGG